MIKGKTLVELAEAIERSESVKRDFVAPISGLRMRDDAFIEGEGLGKALRPNDIFHGQLGSHLNIPTKYYRRMVVEAPELLASNVNTWMSRGSSSHMLRTYDTNGHLTGRAFLSSRYRAIDNFDLAQAVIPILYNTPGLTVKSSEVTDKRMYIQAVTDRLQEDVKVGDPVQAGVIISNSEVGMGMVQVSPLLYRLQCLNGMVSNELSQRRRHLGKAQSSEDFVREVLSDEAKEADDKALFLKLRDVTKASLSEAFFSKQVQAMKEAAGVPIESNALEKVVEVTGRKMGFTEEEGGSILRKLIEGGDLSKWGLANAVTGIANDCADYDRAIDLEAAGGKVIELSPKDWKVISTAS